jgi:hypothetical protein
MERIIDYLAEDLTQRQAKRVKMTEIQKLEYKVYRRECRVSGVEPVLVDFLAGAIPDPIVDLMNDDERVKRDRAMTAVCGV